MQASSLGRRELGRLVGVSSYRVREWLRGVALSGHHLFLLLTLAEDMELRGILMHPDRDLTPCAHPGAMAQGSRN